MKKLLICLCVITLLSSTLISCKESSEKDATITIVTTTFAEFDWTRQILGDYSDGIELILLTKNGTDLHSYQPSVADIAAISNCDILIHNGGSSDFWIDDIAPSKSEQGRIVVKLMSLMSDEEKLEEQSHHHNADHEVDHGDENDEHVWLSLKLAVRFCEAICQAICEKLPDDATHYQKNCTEYTDKLKELDKKYEQSLSQKTGAVLVFADRFPFSYLTNDYDLYCFAAFPGCSAESEASFETISFLSEKVATLALPAVIVLENSDTKIAETIISAAQKENVRIVTVDSLQSVTMSEIENGATYIDIMSKNLDAFLASLN